MELCIGNKVKDRCHSNNNIINIIIRIINKKKHAYLYEHSTEINNT